MKSIDKFVLVLVASLALLLAGCGGGSSTTEPVDPGPTPEEQQQAAIDKAVADALAAAEAERQAEADRMAAEERAAAMAAMTAKLWDAIGETPLASNDTAGTVIAADGTLTVTRSVGGSPQTARPLEENEDATVASLNGWAGSEHTAKPEGDGTYTARLYSNVGEPTMGAKFNDSANGGYSLNAENQIADVTSVTDYAGLVASPRFDQSAGTKTFELSTNTVAVMIPGSFNGVAGTYGCTPTGGGVDCSATVAGSGFTLAGGAWTFTPTDPETRLMNTPDNVYAVYGWWLHETADGATVSAFTGYRGNAATVDITGLSGTATYKGGAAGKYAISAGAHNDSGHFTADAELKAEFNGSNAHMISGTISNFMGGDDMPRDWSVALKEGTLGTDGEIAAVTTGTTWTMGGTDAADSGQWSGNLYEENDGGVPGAGTGTFHSEFGNTGRMVGAFGVNLEE